MVWFPDRCNLIITSVGIRVAFHHNNVENNSSLYFFFFTIISSAVELKTSSQKQSDFHTDQTQKECCTRRFTILVVGSLLSLSFSYTMYRITVEKNYLLWLRRSKNFFEPSFFDIKE